MIREGFQVCTILCWVGRLKYWVYRPMWSNCVCFSSRCVLELHWPSLVAPAKAHFNLLKDSTGCIKLSWVVLDIQQLFHNGRPTTASALTHLACLEINNELIWMCYAHIWAPLMRCNNPSTHLFSSPTLRIGMWKEAKVPGGNPGRHRENMGKIKLATSWLWGDSGTHNDVNRWHCITLHLKQRLLADQTH